MEAEADINHLNTHFRKLRSTMESFELYHKSGARRTIRLKAWGIANKRGILRKYPSGSPDVSLDQQFIQGRRRLGKIVELEVTIKATKKTG